jgi:hypothetical protein
MNELERIVPAAEPDWLRALKAEAERTSQAQVARRLGISASTVNQVLNGVYKADTGRVETLVRGELMNETVACPVLGDLSKRRCLDVQAQPFADTNPQRVQLYRACRHSCPFSSIRED